MKHREFVKSIIDKMISFGAQKAQCSLVLSNIQELNIHSGKICLLRNTINTSLNLLAIIDDKKGTLSINKLDEEHIEEAINTVIEMAQSSQADPANDIAENQPAEDMTNGPLEPDLDAMYMRLDEFNETVKHTYPNVILEEIIIDHTKSEYYFQNSNGVDYAVKEGGYSFSPMFTSKEETKTSSFNYTGLTMNNLDKPLIECGTVNTILSQSTEQVNTKNIQGKFVGDIIVTPDCITDFIGSITGYLRDYSLISKKSLYLDKIGEKIADSKLTLHSMPVSDVMVSKNFITGDGYKNENLTIIENGVLKSYLLSLYGANKIGFKRSVSSGGSYIIDPGETSFNDMIKNVKKGVLLARFSGGNPSDKGDFSGVAKNSYYIEDGEIKYPISEVMVNGNLAEMLFSIKDISKEQVNFGFKIMPWIQFQGITITGK